MKGSIQVKDTQGAMASAFDVIGVPDLASIQNMANGLQSYTRAQILAVSATETAQLNLPAATTGPYCLANQKAVSIFRDLDATGTKGNSLILRIPSPNEVLFQAGQNGDYIVVPAQGAAIAAMINARLGRNVEFVRGFLWNKKRKRK